MRLRKGPRDGSNNDQRDRKRRKRPHVCKWFCWNIFFYYKTLATWSASNLTVLPVVSLSSTVKNQIHLHSWWIHLSTWNMNKTWKMSNDLPREICQNNLFEKSENIATILVLTLVKIDWKTLSSIFSEQISLCILSQAFSKDRTSSLYLFSPLKHPLHVSALRPDDMVSEHWASAANKADI